MTNNISLVASLPALPLLAEIRLTVEQNIILPNVKSADVAGLLSSPAFGKGTRLSVTPGLIEGGVVSCTGSQFCGLALIETKQTAERYAALLEDLVEVRITNNITRGTSKATRVFVAHPAPPPPPHPSTPFSVISPFLTSGF